MSTVSTAALRLSQNARGHTDPWRIAYVSCVFVVVGDIAIATDHVNAHSGHLMVSTVLLLTYSRT